MRTPTETGTLHRPSRRVQLVVWALLAVLVGAGFALTATGMSSSGIDPSAVGATGQTVAATDTLVAAPGEGFRDGVLEDYYGPEGSKGTVNLLPAWRWQDATQLYDALSFDNIAGNFASAIAGLFFSLASFIWALLLGIIKFSVGLDLVRSAARIIDGGFAAITDNIWNSGIVMILLVFAFIIGVKMALKGQNTKAIGVIIALVVPVAFMQALASTVDTEVTSQDTGTYTSPAGSPSWLAGQGVWLIDSTAEGLGSGFGTAAGAAGLGSVAAQTEEGPSCYPYNQVLYHQYNAFNNTDLGATQEQLEDLQSGGSAGAAAQAEIDRQITEASYRQRLSGNVPVVSYLWERAFLRYWTGAQLGYGPQADRAACHLLDLNAGISAREQAQVGKLAGYPVINQDNATSPIDRDHPMKAGVYIYPTKDGKEFESQISAWVACEFDGSKWGPSNPAWSYEDGAGVTEDVCLDWWRHEDGDVNGVLEYGTEDDYTEAFRESLAGGDKANALLLAHNTEYFDALRGDNGGTRMLNGLMAFITALLYAYALGALAIGTVIAQMGVVLLLILLPATLTLLAIPTGEKQRHPAGKRLLRLTGAFMAAKLVLTVVMTLLINTISVFEALLGSLGNGLNGLTHALIPIAALFLIRFLLKQAGLGDLTSLSGSLGMATAGAMAAGGDANGRGLWSKGAAAMASAKADKAGNRLGINRADAFAKKQAKRAALAAPKGAARVGRNAAGALALGDRKRALLGGPKDENGNRTQLGLAQRLRAQAAAAGYRMGGRVIAGKSDAEGNRTGRRILPGSRLAGAHMNRLHGKHVSRAALAEQQRSDLREHIRATQFKSAEGRRLAASQRFDRSEALLAARNDMVMNHGVKPEDLNKIPISYDARSGTASFSIKGATHSVGPKPLAPNVVIDQALAYADGLTLKENQVVANQFGLGATYLPVPRGNSATAKLVQAKTEAGTIELARDVLQYVPDHLKAKRPGWSDDQYSTYLHQLRIAAGGYDPETNSRVDFAKDAGIDLDTEAGKAELRRALAGEETRFDSLQGTVEPSAAQVAAIVARVGRMGRGAAESYEKQVSGPDSVRAVANKVQVEVTEASRDAAKQATNKVQAEKAVLTVTVDQIATVRAQAEEKQGQVQKVEADLSEIVAKLAGLDASSSEYQRAADSKVKIEANLDRVRAAAEEARGKVTFQEETMQNSITAMIDRSMEAITNAAKTQEDAKELELSFDMFLASKKGKDIAPILESAEDFEKQFMSVKAGMENQLFAAQTALMQAYNDGNAKAVRAAAEDLDRMVRRAVAQADQTANKAVGHHLRLEEEQIKELEREIVNNLRYGQGGTRKPKASELMGRIPSVPNS